MLIHLLSDLYRDPELRERFAHEPEQILSDYDIGPEDRELLRKADVHGAQTKVLGEMQTILSTIERLFPLPWPSTREWRVSEVRHASVADGVARTVTVRLVQENADTSHVAEVFPADNRWARIEFFRDENLTVFAEDVKVSISRDESQAEIVGRVAFSSGQYGYYVVRAWDGERHTVDGAQQLVNKAS